MRYFLKTTEPTAAESGAATWIRASQDGSLWIVKTAGECGGEELTAEESRQQISNAPEVWEPPVVA